jgi:hypothetical protein
VRKLYVGQKPSTPLVLLVNDTQGQPVILTSYLVGQMLIKAPSGNMILDGTSALSFSGNKATYQWGTVSIFTEPGDYRFQLKLTKAGGVVDYSTVATIEVLKPLEAS